MANYVPRPQLHQKIKEQLHDQNPDTGDSPRTLVVYGLGGAGKPQLVLNYMRDYRRDYTALFWVEAGSKETIERDYIKIYHLLYGPQSELVKLEDAVLEVKRWFHKRKGQYLLVLDSADDIDNDQSKGYIDLRYFMPDAPGLHIIITSRNATAKEITQLSPVEVAEMGLLEATELFKQAAKMTHETDEIKKIVEELGRLALAITLAGSYVSATPRLSSDIRKYLPEYRQRREKLLERRPTQVVHRYAQSVRSTWETSFKVIEDDNPVAARLLSLLAFVNFEDIFLGLFGMVDTDPLASSPGRAVESSEAKISPSPEWRSFLFNGQRSTVHELESAFNVLQTYSLIQYRSDQESYAMHKLVNAWGQDRLEDDKKAKLSVLALELVADATVKDIGGLGHQVRLVPHVMVSFEIYSRLHAQRVENVQDILARVKTMGNFLRKLGRRSESYNIARFRSSKAELLLGKEHVDTLNSMGDLAVVSTELGRFEEAEQIIRQVMTLREQRLGKEHPDTLMSMKSLAMTLIYQGRCQEAEQINREVMTLQEQKLGKEHSNTLTSMNNLGTALCSQGKHQEAEQIFRDVMMLNEKILGKEHFHTLASMNSLTTTLTFQGKYRKAKQTCRELLSLQEVKLGKEHPETLHTCFSLAFLLHRSKEYESAKLFYKQAYAGFRKKLGNSHPDTANCNRAFLSMLREEQANTMRTGNEGFSNSQRWGFRNALWSETHSGAARHGSWDVLSDPDC